MSSSNEVLARRWFQDVWNLRRQATIFELFAPEGVCHSEQGPLLGPDAFFAKVYEPFLDAFPDFSVDIEGTLSVDEEVLVRWVGHGTHNGSGLGFPPSGLRVTFSGLTWVRFAAGQIVEGRDCWNIGGLLHALQGGPCPPSMRIESPVACDIPASSGNGHGRGHDGPNS